MEAVYFDRIASAIKEEINKATSNIKIAVAWFTNDTLFQAVLKCLERNVNVELVMIDDAINRNELALDFSKFIALGGKLFFSTQKKMHNKFCIVDDSVIMTGSYNWTLYAESINWENLLVSDNSEIISKYREEFQRIVTKSQSITIYRPILFSELKETDLFNNYEYLCNDLSLKGQRYKEKVSKINFETKREVVLNEIIPTEYDERGIPLLKIEWNKPCKRRLIHIQIKNVPSHKPAAGKKYILAYLTFSEAKCSESDKWVHIIDEEYVSEMRQYFHQKDGGLLPDNEPLPDIPEELYTPNRKYRFQIQTCYFLNGKPHSHLDSNGEPFSKYGYTKFSLLARMGNARRDYVGFNNLTEAYSWVINNLFSQGSIDDIDKESSFSYKPELQGIYKGSVDDLYAIRKFEERNLALKQDNRQTIFKSIEKRLKYNPEGYWLDWNGEVIAYIYGIYSYNPTYTYNDFKNSEKSETNGNWFKILTFDIVDNNKCTKEEQYIPLLEHIISEMKNKVNGIVAYAFNIDIDEDPQYNALLSHGFVKNGFFSQDICDKTKIKYGEIIQMQLRF